MAFAAIFTTVSVAADGPTADPMTLAAIEPTLLEDSRPSISDDGEILVTQAVSEGRATIMLVDLSSGEETELTTPRPSARPGHSVMPQLSADGCTVTTMTELALDAFRDDDTGERWDLYQLLLPGCGGELGAWELVSSTAEGSARDDLDPSESFAVSATGSQIAFVHPTDGDVTSISIADLTRPITAADRIMAVAPAEASPPADTLSLHRGLAEPSLSADGSVLAFTAELTGADDAEGWVWAEADEAGEEAARQVLVWFRPSASEADTAPDATADAEADTGRFELVSIRPDGTVSAGAMTPMLSGDGAVVVFVSSDSELVAAQYRPCRDERCARQIFAVGVGNTDDPTDLVADPASGDDGAEQGSEQGADHEIGDGVIRLVSAVRERDHDQDHDQDGDGDLIAGDRSSWLGDVNFDGSQVVFITRAGNLSEVAVAAGGEATDGDLYLAELGLGELTRVTDMVATGVPAAHANPRFSASGRRLVFDTLVGDRLGDAPRTESSQTAPAPGDRPDTEAGLGPADGVDAPGGGPAPADELRSDPVEPTIAVTTVTPGDGDTPARSVVTITTTPKVSMPDLDFGSVIVGLASDERFVRVRNDGPGAFRPDSITTTDARFIVTDNGTCRSGVIVAAGSACTVTVVFRPDDGEPLTAELVVAEDGESADGAAVVRSMVSGAGGEPVIRAEPAGVDLGASVIGALDDDGELLPAAFDVIGFVNVGEVPLVVSDISVSSSDFVVFAEDCTARALGVAGRCEVAVAYRPASAGNHSALVRVSSSQQQYAAAVVSASAEYRPVIETFADAVPAGAPIGVSLVGFAAEAEVVVGLSDRPDTWAAVRTDAEGRAMAFIETRRLERSGQRTIVAVGPGNLRASTTIDIEREQRPAVGLPGFGYGFSGR